MTPLLAWIDARQRFHVRADLVAGLTTGVMLIPQAMAYAMLAGLSPIVGLYASTLPLLAYAVFGGSRQLAVGPVAMDSLLVASALAPLAVAGTGRYLELAVTLALLLGIIQLLLWGLRAGGLLELLRPSVLRGFTSAAAIVIGLTQLGGLLGVSLPRAKQVQFVVVALGESVSDIHLWTVMIGGLSVAVLVALKRFAPRVPRALVVVVLASLAVGLLDLQGEGVAVVGDVPSGLPSLAVPGFAVEDVLTLLPSALILSLIAFIEAAAVGKAMAAARGESLDANRELLGLGLANVSASLVGGYAVTGGFSRTAVNAQAGARSKWAGVVTAAVLLATLQFFTAWFHDLPHAVLAAIIMAAVFGLIDFGEAKRLFGSSRPDFWLWSLTFFGTLFLGIEVGLGAGIAASLVYAGLHRLRTHPVHTR